MNRDRKAELLALLIIFVGEAALASVMSDTGPLGTAFGILCFPACFLWLGITASLCERPGRRAAIWTEQL